MAKERKEAKVVARKFFFSPSLAGLLIGLVALIFLSGPWQRAGALEKVKLGTTGKTHPPFYLPVLAAGEKGFWRDNGLDVEWVPFAGVRSNMMAVWRGAINITMNAVSVPLAAAENGLPVVMVAELSVGPSFGIWVKADSPYREVRDLKATRIGVTTVGGATDIYAQVILAAHGVNKGVRFIETGSEVENIAALKAGEVEAVVSKLPSMAGLKMEGVVRELASSANYLPKPWFEDVLLARKAFVRSKPDVVRKMVKATLQSIDFIRKNPRWSLDKIKAFQGLSEEAAKLIHDNLQFTTTGRFDRKGVENIRRVFVEYEVIGDKAPAVDDLFTNEYLPG